MILWTFYVQPGAKITGWSKKLHGDYLKVKVRPRAENQEANKAFLDFLSQELECSVRLVRGSKNRLKVVCIPSQEAVEKLQTRVKEFSSISN